MDVNELINDALQHGNKMLAGTELYVLEGHADRNELRILTLDELYKNSMMGFMYSIHHGYSVIGIFTTKEAAEEMIVTIRTLFRDEQGNRLL